MAYLTCKELSVGYAGTPVACDISFSIGAGDALFVVGENGAGKSTLLKTLLGLLPPLDGEVAFGDGVSAGEIGYLPQKGESQRDFPASAWEIALSGRATRLGMRVFYTRADKAATEEALRHAGAYELRNEPFGSLSGGQQQRVLLARALAAQPRLLVLDEPTTGLDPEAAEALYRTIDELRERGAGVLVVTHDVTAALPHATQVLAVQGGGVTLSTASAYLAEHVMPTGHVYSVGPANHVMPTGHVYSVGPANPADSTQRVTTAEEPAVGEKEGLS